MSGTERTSGGAIVALLLLGAAAGVGGAALARSGAPASPAPTAAPALSASASRLSRAQVIAIAQRRYAARVLRATLSKRNGHLIYVLLMLSGRGKVWTVLVDARSGQEVR